MMQHQRLAPYADDWHAGAAASRCASLLASPARALLPPKCSCHWLAKEQGHARYTTSQRSFHVSPKALGQCSVALQAKRQARASSWRTQLACPAAPDTSTAVASALFAWCTSQPLSGSTAATLASDGQQRRHTIAVSQVQRARLQQPRHYGEVAEARRHVQWAPARALLGVHVGAL
jgi:hypothetical protein